MIKSIEDVISQYNGEFNLLNYANGLVIKKNIVAQLSCAFDYDMNDFDKHNEQCHYFTGCYVNSTFYVSFRLDNSNSLIPPYLFNVIESHFRNLHLLERYKQASFKIISEFYNTIRGSLTTQSLDNALNSARATIRLNQEAFGYNQFENILKLKLCNGLAFRQYCQDQGY